MGGRHRKKEETPAVAVVVRRTYVRGGVAVAAAVAIAMIGTAVSTPTGNIPPQAEEVPTVQMQPVADATQAPVTEQSVSSETRKPPVTQTSEPVETEAPEKTEAPETTTQKPRRHQEEESPSCE